MLTVSQTAALLRGLYSRIGESVTVLSGTLSVRRIFVRYSGTRCDRSSFSHSPTTSALRVCVSSTRDRSPGQAALRPRSCAVTANTPSSENLSASAGIITSRTLSSAATLASV